MAPRFIHLLNFWLSEHPSIVQFRWSPTESWAATWWFLITSITAYIAISAALHILLRLLRRQHYSIPLGPIPALHSLSMSLVSAVIFAGMLTSSVAEIRDTRWLWRRSKTPFQWLLCFPLGTRPSGRVFFWSYAFYLSRFLHILRTFFSLLRRPGEFPLFQIVNHSVLICMAFLWLEFSQSFQVLAILSMTLVFSLVYGYRFCVDVGLKKQKGFFPFEILCRIVLVVTIAAWHVGVLVLHFWKGGCNGMGAWLFNTLLNSCVLLFLLNSYVKKCLSERDGFAPSSSSSSSSSSAYKLLSSSSGSL